MKKIFTSVFFIITSIVSAQTSFKTRINTGNYNLLNGVIQMNDGTYIGIGTNNYINSPSILLIKLNEQGALISSTTISTSGDNNGLSIIKTSDGGFAVGGSLGDEIAILKFNIGLKLQWKKQYFSGNVSGGSKLIQTVDGGFIIVGEISDNTNIGAGLLVKTDSIGNLLFSKQYFDFAGNSHYIPDIKATNDGNYVMLGGVDNDDPSVHTTYILKIKPDGSILWSKAVNIPNGYSIGSSILQTSDGGLVIGGGGTTAQSGSPGYFEQMLMVKLNSSGALLWSKGINSPDTTSSGATSVLEDTDGGYIFAGFFSKYSNNFTMDSSGPYIVKINSGGVLQWTKTFDKLSNFSISNMIHTSDGSYAGVGITGLENNNSTLVDGIIYKFGSGFEFCDPAGSNGSTVDMGSIITENIAVHDITTSTENPRVTLVSVGTATSICNILPIRLVSFDATLQNKSVMVRWKSADEVNTDHYTVEKSSDAITFSPLQTLLAKGASTLIQTYGLIDMHPLPGTSYYRLKEYDKDGRVTYSNTVSVTFASNGSITIHPNPVKNNITVLIQSPFNSQAIFQITDITGRVLSTQSTKVIEGTNSVLLPAAFLPKGVYVLKIIQNDQVQSLKFLKR